MVGTPIFCAEGQHSSPMVLRRAPHQGTCSRDTPNRILSVPAVPLRNGFCRRIHTRLGTLPFPHLCELAQRTSRTSETCMLPSRKSDTLRLYVRSCCRRFRGSPCKLSRLWIMGISTCTRLAFAFAWILTRYYRWDLQMGQRGQLHRIPLAHSGPVLTLDWTLPSTFNGTSQMRVAGPAPAPQSTTWYNNVGAGLFEDIGGTLSSGSTASGEGETSGMGWLASGGMDRCVKVRLFRGPVATHES